MKILVVDDLPANLALAESVLETAGYDPILANSGHEALKILESDEEIQLLIVDWMMPEMDGIELVKIVRRDFQMPYKYIIMLTAKGQNQDIITGLESGLDDYIVRPYSVGELEARVKVGERIISLENTLRDSILSVEYAKQEWEATTDSIAQLVCLVDHDGVVLRTNATVEAWGLAWAHDVYGTSLPDLLSAVYPSFAKQLQEHWSDAHDELTEGLEYEFEGMDAERGHFFHVQYEPIDPYGEFPVRAHSFAAVNIHDITERKHLEIQLQQAKEQVEIEHQKSEELLLNILPESIAERLKGGEQTIAESFENVSVMFLDLVGFTKMTTQISPEELINMLNAIFVIFDDITEKYNLEKIKTIGDSYMAVSGVPIPDANHAQNMVSAAIEMRQAIQKFDRDYHLTLGARIGIASGSVVAGVIGRKKFIYDLWGDTVNTASRMESHGISGEIQVTERTAQLLGGKFQLESRGQIEVKGKGAISTYLVKG